MLPPISPTGGSGAGMVQRPCENDVCSTGMDVLPYLIYSLSGNFSASTGFCGGQKRCHDKSLKIKSGNVLPQRHHKICG